MNHTFCKILGVSWPSSRMIPQKYYIEKSKELYSLLKINKNYKNDTSKQSSYTFHNSRFN